MESAKRDLFVVTLDILREDSEANRAAIAELADSDFQPVYSSDESCYWQLISPFKFQVIAVLTLGEEPILLTINDKDELVRRDWGYWFGPAVDEAGVMLTAVSKHELCRMMEDYHRQYGPRLKSR